MNRNKITFWASTSIMSAMMLFSAVGYFTNPDMKATFEHLGFPDYFRIELGILKILGGLVLIIPMISDKAKSLAYFGFALTFVSGAIAHIDRADPISMIIMPLIFLGILAISYYFRPKRQSHSKK